ncbi:hypothetical protein [Bacillus mycoides]|uniref:hypothetical protein n=1 Tax=Bacillus mycoides TaxID=1405 RepID=UPI0024AD4CC9|nr:hypothetical protein [Bacillus mycoides]MDI6535167.1 hypothetical protein [Bacillus mycoides]
MTITEKVAMAFKSRKALDKQFKRLDRDDLGAVEKLQAALSRHVTVLTHVRYFAGDKPVESLNELIEHYESMQESLY